MRNTILDLNPLFSSISEFATTALTARFYLQQPDLFKKWWLVLKSIIVTTTMIGACAKLSRLVMPSRVATLWIVNGNKQISSNLWWILYSVLICLLVYQHIFVDQNVNSFIKCYNLTLQPLMRKGWNTFYCKEQKLTIHLVL